MTTNLSNKIKMLSFLATIMVVYRHSLNYMAFFHSWSANGLNGFVQDGCMVFTQVAVPYFFIVSGFFFLKNDYDHVQTYWAMIKKKSRTLLLPFLIWNLVGLVCLLVTQQPVEWTDMADFTRQLFESRYYGPLWYVRDIMVLMAIVPLYQWIINKNKIFLYLIIGIVLFYLWIPVDCGFLSSEGLLFFFLGGILQKYEQVLEWKMPNYLFVVLLAIWMGLCLFTPAFHYLHKFCTLLGVVVCWFFMDYCQLHKHPKLISFSQYAFIIYVLHFYPLKVMKVALGKMFWGNEWVSMGAYLLLPLLTILLAIGIGYTFRRFAPKLYFLSTGGR